MGVGVLGGGKGVCGMCVCVCVCMCACNNTLYSSDKRGETKGKLFVFKAIKSAMNYKPPKKKKKL